jgi:hypothetical protein
VLLDRSEAGVLNRFKWWRRVTTWEDYGRYLGISYGIDGYYIHLG